MLIGGREGGCGEYPNQGGFAWTDGLTRRLLDLYPDVLKPARTCATREKLAAVRSTG